MVLIDCPPVVRVSTVAVAAETTVYPSLSAPGALGDCLALLFLPLAGDDD